MNTKNPGFQEKSDKVKDLVWDFLSDKLGEIFPEIKSGDVSPEELITLNNAMDKFIYDWHHNNKAGQ